MSPAAFALEEHATLVVEAGRALRRHDVSPVHRYPARYDPLVLPYEPVNVWNALRRDSPHLLDRTAVPGLYRWMLARRRPALEHLTRLTVDEQPGRRDQWGTLFGSALVDRLIEAGVLVPFEGGYRSRLRFLPCYDQVFVCDGADERVPMMVWLGKDTMHLLAAMERHLAGMRVGRGLEVGSGSGLLTIRLSRHCEQTVGVDVNPRAIACGTINQRINDIPNVEFRRSDLFADVPESFDIVIGNPPYVYMPPDVGRGRLHSHGGDDYGIDLQLEILAALDRKLNADGLALLLCCSPVVGRVDVLPDRLRRRLRGTRLRVHLEPLFNATPPELLDFHDACGIRYTWAYLVTVRRAAAFTLHVQPPTPWTRLSSSAYRALVRARRRLQPAAHAPAAVQ